MITKEEFAAKLDGREYPFDLTDAESTEAKSNALLVVFGASDDLAELRGAACDETGADAFCVSRHDGELLETPDRDELDILDKYGLVPVIEERQREAIKIIPIWDDGGPYLWVYETTQPHATFDIKEDDGLYCRGIVIDLKEKA